MTAQRTAVVSCVRRCTAVDAEIRPYQPPDEAAIIALSLRAWEPVFASLAQVLGDELFARLHPASGGWPSQQADAVRRTLGEPAMRSWVAGAGGTPVGFVSAKLLGDRDMGEIVMLAVDPGHQGGGIGAALMNTATQWLRASGARVALVETGGDPGHAAARHVYSKVGYTLLPVARYFQPL